MDDSAEDREAIEKAVQQLSEGYRGVKEALDGMAAQAAPPRFLKASHGALDVQQCERTEWYPSLDRALEKIDQEHLTVPAAEVEVGGLWVSKATGKGHAVRLRIERYRVRDAGDPLTERGMLWLWRDDVWKHDKALQHRRRRLRHLLEAAERLSGCSGADSCWVVYPAELDLERESQVLPPIASEYDVALDSFDLSIALGFYALLCGITSNEASPWWATGALATGDGSGPLGARVTQVTELGAKSRALADAGEAGTLLYPADNGADPADAGIAAGMHDRATAVETLGEAVALLGWPLPDHVPHPRQYARWARGRTRARIAEMVRLGDYQPTLYVERKEATDALRGFLAQREVPLLLVEGSSGTGKSNWLAHEAARMLASAGPETAVVLTSVRDVTAKGQPEDLTPKLPEGDDALWILELAASGAEIVWLIDGLETESDPRSWVANHVMPVVQALDPGALGRLKVVLVGQPHAVAPLIKDETVTKRVFDPAPPDPKAPLDGLSGHRPVLRLDGFDEASARAAYQARTTAGGCLTPWHALPEGVRKVLALPVMGRVFHGLYAGSSVSESLGVRELLAKAADVRLEERAGHLHGGAALVAPARALLGSLAAYLWEERLKASPDADARVELTRARVAVLIEEGELPATDRVDAFALFESVVDVLRLVLAAGLVREVASGSRKALRFELDVWPAYFLAEHLAAARGSAGDALMDLCRRRDPGAYGERAVELLAARALSGFETRGAWAEVLAAGAEPWSWMPLLQAWLDVDTETMDAVAWGWVEVAAPERAVEQIAQWSGVLPWTGRARITMTRMLWVPALRTSTGIEDRREVGEDTWVAQVESALSRFPERVRDLALGLGSLGWALRSAQEPLEATSAHREEVALWRLLAGVTDPRRVRKAAWEARVRAALSRCPNRVRDLSKGLNWFGWALQNAQDPLEAAAAHREAVALCRVLTGVPDPREVGEPAWEVQVQAVLSRSPKRVRDLAIGLGRLGWALRTAQDPQSAAAAHKEEVALCRLLCGVPDPQEAGAVVWDAQVQAALSRWPERVVSLAIGLNGLGWALRCAEEPKSAATAHREDVALSRLMAGIQVLRDVGEAAWEAQVQAALGRWPERVRNLAIGLGTFGWALENAQEPQTAATLHWEEVALCRLLAGVRDPRDVGTAAWGAQVQAALSRWPERVRELALGLGKLGHALNSAQEPRTAAAVHAEEVALKRLLAGVPDPREVGEAAWEAQVRAALSRWPERARELSNGLGRLGQALNSTQDPQSAAATHREEVVLRRLLAGVWNPRDVGEAVWKEQVRAALSRWPERVRELSNGLGKLGQALRSARDPRSAAAANREEVALKRLLAAVRDPREVGEAAWEARVRATLSRWPERVRELAIGLGRLGQALESAQDPQSAAVHREEVALKRLLAGVPDPAEVGAAAWEAQVEGALGRWPERVRDLAIGLVNHGAVMWSLEPGDAVPRHEEAAALARGVARLPAPGALQAEAQSRAITAAVARARHLVIETVLRLKVLARSYREAGRPDAATEVLREAAELERYLNDR